jgi:hypothetical protein
MNEHQSYLRKKRRRRVVFRTFPSGEVLEHFQETRANFLRPRSWSIRAPVSVTVKTSATRLFSVLPRHPDRQPELVSALARAKSRPGGRGWDPMTVWLVEARLSI